MDGAWFRVQISDCNDRNKTATHDHRDLLHRRYDFRRFRRTPELSQSSIGSAAVRKPLNST